MSASQEAEQLPSEGLQYVCDMVETVSMNDLGLGLTRLLHIQDDYKLESNCCVSPLPEQNDCSNVDKKDECRGLHLSKSIGLISKASLPKEAISMCSSKETSFAECMVGEEADKGNDEQEDNITAAVLKQSGYESLNPSCFQQTTIPTPLKLVSALKGSREKQGTPPKNLSVTWAPNVYDPLPSAHTFIRIKKPRPKSESKKNYDYRKNGKSKSKQKGKLDKGSSSKDKKHAQRYGGNFKRCYQALDNDDMAVAALSPMLPWRSPKVAAQTLDAEAISSKVLPA